MFSVSIRCFRLTAMCWLTILSVGCMMDEDGQWSRHREVDWVRRAAENNLTIAGPAPVSNIVRVNKIFHTFPWLSFDPDGSGRIDGFKCTVYLESPDSHDKGVFGTGTIVVDMYRLDRDPLGKEVATLVQEWELPPEEAYVWQAREPSLIGWAYGLRLRWNDEVNVSGKKVAFVIKYVREDGRVVPSARKVFKVPLSGDSAGGIS
ncbi:MAG: hypothetical protein ACE5EC_08555 [Phycisphaerae bacterium]